MFCKQATERLCTAHRRAAQQGTNREMGFERAATNLLGVFLGATSSASIYGCSRGTMRGARAYSWELSVLFLRLSASSPRAPRPARGLIAIIAAVICFHSFCSRTRHLPSFNTLQFLVVLRVFVNYLITCCLHVDKLIWILDIHLFAWPLISHSAMSFATAASIWRRLI